MPPSAHHRPVIVAVLLVLLAVYFAPACAQSNLIVSPDGPYTTIEAALAAAAVGDTIEVHGGVYPAPLIVDKSVTLLGVDQPVIDGQGAGSLVLIRAPEAVFSGFTVRSSGQSLSHEDTGIVVQGANVVVRDNVLEDVLFGIYFANASGGIAQNNIIRGKALEESVRGDGVRVWYSDNVQLLDNDVMFGRDMLIWYADNITIRGNTIHNNRYGLHFMYNKSAVVEDNIIEDNTVGAYMMYSADLVMARNQFLNNRGVSGYGVALKDMDGAHITENMFVSNVVGVYLDNSPALYDVYNTFSDNFVAYNDIGLMGLPSLRHNIFQDNGFVENLQQIAVQGRGSLLNNQWSADGVGNYWSNYVGYDRDNDGIGDMPFRAEKLFESLTDSSPALRLFLFSPASQAIDFAAAAFPSLRPDPKAIDEAPQMQYAMPAAMTSEHRPVSAPLLAVALLMIGVGALLCVLGLNPSRRARSSPDASKIIHANT